MNRKAKIERKTKETDITISLNLDGEGESSVDTTLPFLDHMLTLFSRHGLMDLQVKGGGDTQVDYHHLIEDTGIALGEAIKKAVGDKTGIERYGSAFVPMDETLAEVHIDLSGRPYLVYEVKTNGTLKDLDPSLFEDFFRALSNHAMLNLHIIVRYGRDAHHVIEAVFKAFARALARAVSINPKVKGLPTTKGTL
jgi:imidazoleglycerol-phosphate dehydratase